MKFAIAAGLALATSLLAIENEPAHRLDEAAPVFSRIMAAPDKGIPRDLLEQAPPPGSAAAPMTLLNTYFWRER